MMVIGDVKMGKGNKKVEKETSTMERGLFIFLYFNN